MPSLLALVFVAVLTPLTIVGFLHWLDRWMSRPSYRWALARTVESVRQRDGFGHAMWAFFGMFAAVGLWSAVVVVVAPQAWPWQGAVLIQASLAGAFVVAVRQSPSRLGARAAEKPLARRRVAALRWAAGLSGAVVMAAQVGIDELVRSAAVEGTVPRWFVAVALVLTLCVAGALIWCLAAAFLSRARASRGFSVERRSVSENAF